MSEGLAIYLDAPGKIPSIGPERGKRVRDGIARYTGLYGSTRYVYYIDSKPVAVLQVVARDEEGRRDLQRSVRARQLATIANVYTAPAMRRTGLASMLLARARRDFRTVEHAAETHLSDAGRAWRDARR